MAAHASRCRLTLAKGYKIDPERLEQHGFANFRPLLPTSRKLAEKKTDAWSWLARKISVCGCYMCSIAAYTVLHGSAGK